MPEEKSKGLDLGYESSLSASYLVVKLDGGIKIFFYQMEVIANNPTPNILSLSLKRTDGTASFYYDITSKLSLAQFLKRRVLTRDEFLQIVLKITKTLLECEGYFLSDKGFLLKEEHIYINPETLETALVYVPAALDNTAAGKLEDLVRYMLFAAKIQEENDNFVQRIINQIKSEMFNVAAFDKFLKELKYPIPIPEESPKKGNSTFTPGYSEGMDNVRNSEKDNSERAENTNLGNSRPGMFKIRIPKTIPKNDLKPVKSMDAEGRKNEDYGKKVVFKKNMAVIVLSQLVFAGVLVALLASGVLRDIGDDTTATYILTTLILIAIDFLVLKRLIPKSNHAKEKYLASDSEDKKSSGEKKGIGDRKNRRDRKSSEEKKYNSVSLPDKDAIRGILPELKQIPNIPEISSEKESCQDEPLNAGDGAGLLHIQTKYHSVSGNETMLLKLQPESHPYLENRNGRSQERISITKHSFMIGRLKEQVDYVSSNTAVGKIHAEIITKNGICYLKDLNSRNGTYINKVRIDSNKEYEMKNNDIITFANSDYTFILP